MAFKANFSTVDIDVDINFESNINLVIGESSTGKTYLGKLLSRHFNKRDSKVKLQYYNISNFKDINFDTSDIFILDNADLYIDKEFIDKILRYKDKTFIIYCRRLFDLIDYSNLYELEYNNRKIKSVRLNL